ncbi:Uncharacterised protein [Mycobacteroides abscessus subsp. massiliense]|nr:Uncharacterised protein [Mycobacteroides abscessus subsp. massiliense]
MCLGEVSVRMRSAARASENARGRIHSEIRTPTTMSAYRQPVVRVMIAATSTPTLPTASANTSM